MAKISKEELARLSGAGWALEKVKEKGLEATEKELEMRGAIGLPLAFSHQDKINCENQMRRTICTGLNLLFVMTLHDELGWGAKRIMKVIDRFNLKARCVADDYCDWRDIIDVVANEIKVNIPGLEEFLDDLV